MKSGKKRTDHVDKLIRSARETAPDDDFARGKAITEELREDWLDAVRAVEDGRLLGCSLFAVLTKLPEDTAKTGSVSRRIYRHATAEKVSRKDAWNLFADPILPALRALRAETAEDEFQAFLKALPEILGGRKDSG